MTKIDYARLEVQNTIHFQVNQCEVGSYGIKWSYKVLTDFWWRKSIGFWQSDPIGIHV